MALRSIARICSWCEITYIAKQFFSNQNERQAISLEEFLARKSQQVSKKQNQPVYMVESIEFFITFFLKLNYYTNTNTTYDLLKVLIKVDS